jgi:hypothetical protein
MAEENPNQVRENEPADLGYAPPNTGQGEVEEAEIPEGADSISSEQVSAAEERGGGGGDGDDGALDVSAVLDDDSGDADADEAGEADDAGDDDATAKTDEEAQSEPDTGEAG